MAQKIFFITGVSSGLGRALAEEALAAGHRVAGTLRSDDARLEFEQLKPGHAFGKLMEVTKDAVVERVVAEVEAEVGPIDVVVNNAGYGYEGTVEESPLQDLREQFAVNVFGAVAVIKAVLPFMRERRRGHIINITSMSGLVTFAGMAYYNGSKFALEGISSALGKEVKGIGIAVTAVAPGAFRTDWAGRSMVYGARSVADYDAVVEPLRASLAARNGKQAGDPAKAARAILQLVESKNPPAHLLLGTDVLEAVRANLKSFEKEIAEWEAVSVSTNFD